MAKKQAPTPPNEWLYKDEGEDNRLFAKEVTLPDSASFWAECTTAEKEEWEREHPQPEPQEPEKE